MLNLGKLPYEIKEGDRIAQMVVSKYEAITWDETDLADSDARRTAASALRDVRTLLARFRLTR